MFLCSYSKPSLIPRRRLGPGNEATPDLALFPVFILWFVLTIIHGVREGLDALTMVDVGRSGN